MKMNFLTLFLIGTHVCFETLKLISTGLEIENLKENTHPNYLKMKEINVCFKDMYSLNTMPHVIINYQNFTKIPICSKYKISASHCKVMVNKLF